MKAGWILVHDWRQALGLCKWLCRGSRSFSELTAAAAADWQVLELASPPLADQARASRRNYMDDHLALALAADAPLIGLKIYEAAGMKPPMEAATSPVRFGHWACRHLVDRGTRDQAFVSRGREMLTANMLPRFCEGGGDLVQAALWLKAIYFDSGVAQTPEQTIARAYDSMPGSADGPISSRCLGALLDVGRCDRALTAASSGPRRSAGRGAPAPSDSRCSGR